jgi:hypothetical protein
MSEETKDWELWRQRNGHVVVVKRLDNDDPDLYQFRSVNFKAKGWFPRGRHSLNIAKHPADLVRFLGIVRSDDQKPNQSRPCQGAEIDRLQAEIESLAERLRRAEIVAAESLQKWETTEQVCLKIITELVKGVQA